MCKSLAANKYDISLIVADGLGNETRNNIRIIDIGARTGGRLSRMTKTVHKVFEKAKILNADIYHLHDPELIPIGLKLKKIGKVVIFDSHEDVPKQMLGKPYLNAPLRHLIGQAFALYEEYACNRLDAIIAATPCIRNKFLDINPNTVGINNFPMLGELESATDWRDKQKQACYIGGIAEIRGIREIVRAMELIKSDTRLQLAGTFSESNTEREVKSYAGWQSVDELGHLDRSGVRTVLGQSIAGLVTFHPLPNHVDAQPNKMFEYMSAGIPVIASNFPLWREIIENNDCGICVDPMNPQVIAEAIDFIVTYPERAQQMGKNGRRAIQERYNWYNEAQKLLKLYKQLSTKKW
jgi:glycosyltransferase involved in cell wall biosynthesis